MMKENANRPKIGFVGHGYIGKNYANDFERRGYEVVRYSLEEPYITNKEKISTCDIVFIAVPTPTVPSKEGQKTYFDDSIVRGAIGLVGEGKIVVVKSTILPGTTESFQQDYPDRVVLYSPEFLSEATAGYDAEHPFCNIVGISADDAIHRTAAEQVLSILPQAPFSRIMSSTEAEIVKYSHNASGYVQIILFNLMYDLAQSFGYSWENIELALKADPLISNRYANPIHKSGRGAGGHCFIKDFAALREIYEERVGDPAGLTVFSAVEEKNISLLQQSKKDLDLLEGVYGSNGKTTRSLEEEFNV